MGDSHDGEIVHRELNTNRENPAVEIAEAVADMEDRAVDELPTTYECIDGMLAEIYGNPPAPEAQIEVEFTYADYRITVDQTGGAEFVQVA